MRLNLTRRQHVESESGVKLMKWFSDNRNATTFAWLYLFVWGVIFVLLMFNWTSLPSLLKWSTLVVMLVFTPDLGSIRQLVKGEFNKEN